MNTKDTAKVRWSQARLLNEARTRTKRLAEPVKVQEMLGNLLIEAGWEEDEFIDALCQDVIKSGRPAN